MVKLWKLNVPIKNNDEPESLCQQGKDEAKQRLDVCIESGVRTLQSRESEKKYGIDKIK